VSVGDFVSVRRTDESLFIARLSAKLIDQTPAAIVSGPMFPNQSNSTRRRLWGSIVWIAVLGLGFATLVIVFLELAGVPTHWTIAAAGASMLGLSLVLTLVWRSQRGNRSLLSLMEERHDIGWQPTVRGFEAIGVPFPHAIFTIGGDGFEFRAELERQATRTFEDRWRNYVDPLIGLCARVISDPRLANDELMIFFGRGIFAPRSGEKPIGRVDIRLPGGAHTARLALPDGSPAGLYRGQSSLAFSMTTRLTPATMDSIQGVSGIFCLNTTREGDEPVELQWSSAPGEISSTPGREPIEVAGYDAAIRVGFPDAEFDVCVLEDDRPSRLLHARPAAGAFAIVGVLEPTTRPYRWWVDLDPKGQLVSSALRRVARSLVCQGSTCMHLEWSMSGVKRRGEAPLDVIVTPEGQRRAALAGPHRAFGWLSRPQRSTPILYVPEQGAVFSLDWLDFAGAVEDRPGDAVRLAAWCQRSGIGGVMPGRESPPEDRVLAAAPGEWTFASQAGGDLEIGVRFLCGPLILEIIAGAEA
jgi:hypothetical protein